MYKRQVLMRIGVIFMAGLSFSQTGLSDPAELVPVAGSTSIAAAATISVADFEPATMTIPASSLLDEDLLKGEHYTIAESVTVDGYMNHYTVETGFGQFTAVGNLALIKLLNEIDVIVELKKITSFSAGADAAVDAVADTGKSVVNLVVRPVDSVKGMSAGVSRFFKRTIRTASNVSSEVVATVSGDDEEDVGEEDGDSSNEAKDEPGVTSQLTSSFLGVGKAQRKLAKEFKVDPYSDNAVLQAELNRVAEIAGTVGKISKILIPIPSIVGTAASVGDMVWNLSPTDLLIQNEETLKALGYTDDLIKAFFSSKAFSPTTQTALVIVLEGLDKVPGREVILAIANRAKSKLESGFMIRSAMLILSYHETIEPVIEIITVENGLLPIGITTSKKGVMFAPLDQFLWTEEMATAMARLATLIDAHGITKESLIWVGGRVSDQALSQLSASGWVESTEALKGLEAKIRK